MGILKKGAKPTPALLAPPIFTRSSRDLLKMPSARRLNLHLSLPSLDATASSMRKIAGLHASSPSLDVSSGSPNFPKGRSRPPRSTSSQSLGKKNLAERRASNDSSVFEEIYDEISYYEEEILTDDDFEFEDEVIDETAVPVSTAARPSTIQFDGYDSIRATIHINDYTTGEISKTWYNGSEYDKMVQAAKTEVAKAEAHAFSESLEKKKKGKDKLGKTKSKTDKKKKKKTKKINFDIRGLEGWSAKGSDAVRALRERAVDAVWEEQCRQMQSGRYDIEKIREEYYKISQGSQAAAEARAAEDRIQADQIHGPSEDKVRRTPMFGVANVAILLKAKRKFQKAISNSSRPIEKGDEDQVYRRPSHGFEAQLGSVFENLDDSASLSFDVATIGASVNDTGGHYRNNKPMMPRQSFRTASWEAGLSSGKY